MLEGRWQWWEMMASGFFNPQLIKVWCEDILQPMDLTPSEHQFRKSFLGGNWLWESHSLVWGGLEFLVERSGEGKWWGRLGQPEVLRWRMQTTGPGGLGILLALCLTRSRLLCLFGLSFLAHKMNELEEWEKHWSPVWPWRSQLASLGFGCYYIKGQV